MELTTNNIDDGLLKLMNENLNTEEQKMFVKSFQMYLQYGDDDKAFVINLDDVWEWVGFSEKGKAKNLLIKNFDENVHYTILLAHSVKQKIQDDNRGGHNKETIMLTVNTFKKFCMKASTKRAEQVCDYYLKMENIMHKYTQDKLVCNNNLLKEKDKIIESKDKELQLLLEARKNSKHISGFIYIACNLKEANKNIYKVGGTQDPSKRITNYNTGECDNAFQFISQYEVKNWILAEKLIHTYLQTQKFKYNKEFFNIELSKLIDIMNLFVTFVNELYQENTDISTQIILLTNKIKNESLNKEELVKILQENKSGDNVTININTELPRFFDKDVYTRFANEVLRINKESKIATYELLDSFEKYTKGNSILPREPINGGSAYSYYYNSHFKREFIKMVEDIFDIKEGRFRIEKSKPHGFQGLELNNKNTEQ